MVRKKLKVELSLTEDEYKELNRLRLQAGQQWKTYLKNLIIRNSKRPKRRRFGARRRLLLRNRKRWYEFWK